jgi:uncharacterized protein YyaL (SSP411 family)
LLDAAYLPTTLALAIPAGTAGLPMPLAKPATGAVNAWICEGMTCLPPLATREQLRHALQLEKITPSLDSPLERSTP